MSIKTLARGYNWRDGHGQYSKETMTKAIKMKTSTNDKLIDVQSMGAKYGRQSKFKKDFREYMKADLAYGDYSQGARHPYFYYHDMDPGTGDGQLSQEKRSKAIASDFIIECTEEVNNRMGEQIYGNMIPDSHHAEKEHDSHNVIAVGGERLGFQSFETGLIQAGHDRYDWEDFSKPIVSEYETDPNKVTHDHVRATMISKPLTSYDPRTLWIGSGHMPGSKRMREIPMHV